MQQQKCKCPALKILPFCYSNFTYRKCLPQSDQKIMDAQDGSKLFSDITFVDVVDGFKIWVSCIWGDLSEFVDQRDFESTEEESPRLPGKFVPSPN